MGSSANSLRDSCTAGPWRRPWLYLILVLISWCAFWLVLVDRVTGGREFGSDYPTFAAYLHDPWMLFTDRHLAVFGSGIAAPLLPVSLAVPTKLYEPILGRFLALRLTVMLYAVFGIACGFHVALRRLGPPVTRREWLFTAAAAAVPVGWVASTIMSQDDCVAAAWSGVALCVWVGGAPVAAAVVTGLGMFFAKPFLATTILAIWICSPGRRWPVAFAGSFFVAALTGLYFWRDGALPFGSYVIVPYMGASPYGIAWMLFEGFRDSWLIKNISGVLTAAAFGAFSYFAWRKRLSPIATTVGLYSLFFTFFLGVMPEYEMWCLPFVVALMYAAIKERAWTVFAIAWFHSFVGYAYKFVYGLNPRFESSGKPSLKNWYLEHIGIDVQPLQILLALATIASSFALAVILLRRDVTRKIRAADHPVASPEANAIDGA